MIPDSRLVILLREQLKFLRTSAREFDRGNEAESKRLATTLRVLFHNTNHSKSLFHQLGMEGCKMLRAPEQFRKQELLDHVFFKTDKTGSFAVPRLDQSRLTETTLEVWWDLQIVHSYPPSTKSYAGIRRIQYTRKDVVLAAANKDGGAHVDPTLEEFYKHLAAEGEGAVGMTVHVTPTHGPREQLRAENTHLAMIRDFTFEVLESAERYQW
jgi:hypothetical protein